MNARADYRNLAAQSIQAMMGLEKTLADSPLDHAIIDLVKIRASQMNGCLFCLDMHSKEAKIHGERELKLYHLPLWRESNLFTAKEKAALEWTEWLTRLEHHGISDENYAKIASHFTEKEIADLTIAICSINAWNRLGVAFLPKPGSLDKLMGLDKSQLE